MGCKFGVDLSGTRRQDGPTILSYTEEMECRNVTEAIFIIFLSRT
jgi:hypothetical protein